MTEESGRQLLLSLIKTHAMPFSIEIKEGKARSIEQNNLQRLWINEIAAQHEGWPTEEIRGYCKLTIGIPILREENDNFRKQYDSILKPLGYEDKMRLMMEPIDLPVTRIMTSKQKKMYLDKMHQHWTEKGVVLTDPDGD